MSFSIKKAAWPTFRTSLLPLLATAAFFAVATSFPLHQHSLRAAERPADPNLTGTVAVAPPLGQTQQIEAQRASILRRSAVSTSLAEHTLSSLIIAEITNALPPGMSLINFSIDSCDASARVTVSALSVSQQQTMQFIRALQRQSSFVDVRLESGNPLQNPVGSVTIELTFNTAVLDSHPIDTTTAVAEIKPLAVLTDPTAK